jgi:hypothetical protein
LQRFCSPLTQEIWRSTKANAGSSGYLEIAGSYTQGELETAYNDWKRFKKACNRSPAKSTFLSSIHSPGKGKAEDKTAKGGVRSSRFQMDFITVWGVTGTSDTIIHACLNGGWTRTTLD